MAASQHHVSKRMLPGLLSIIWALAAVAGCSATEPPTFVCPEINASLTCTCKGSRVTCNGLGASTLAFIEPSTSAIRTLLASHNDLRELPADVLTGATNLQELTLSYNKIASIDERFFESLPSLVILDLSHNNLAEFYLPQNALPSLVILDLSHNNLAEFYLPKNALPSLEILNLTNNFLSRLRFDAQRPKKSLQSGINRNNMCGFRTSTALSGEGLEQLYLSHNKIGNNLNFLRNLTNLTILTLGFNNISKIEPTQFPCDEKLRCLHLDNNLLSDLNFLKCTEFLARLNVSSNLISEIPENAFIHLTILQSLDIADNRIENPRFLHNVSQSTISSINLSRNKLSAIPANSMKKMSRLTYVDVSYNELSDISFAGNLENLEDFFAGNNKISQVFLKSRGNVIKTLSLSNNLVTNIDFLKQLPNITRLDLHNNTINEIKHDAMSYLKKLEKLDLSNNKISNVNFVNEVPVLRFLKLSNNYVTQIPCNKVVQKIFLDGNDIRSFQLSCVPNLRYLYMHGGIFKDRKEQELRISKEVELGIHNNTFIFPCFPNLEIILKCKKQFSQTEADEISCESHGTIFGNPITIVIYCITGILLSLVVFLIVAKCYRQRQRRVDNNRECLCGKTERVHRHHLFRGNELCC